MNWYFYSKNRKGTEIIVELRNRDRDTAFRIAQAAGWRPSVWYNPYTWSNYVIMG